MDPLSSKANKYEEFAGKVHNWTLKQDIELRDDLRNSISGILTSMEEFDSMGNDLERDLDLLEIRLGNVRNRIGCVKMERLVEEHVDDLSADILLDRRKIETSNASKNISMDSRAEFERRTINAISNAIRRGFELFDSVQLDQQPGTSLGSADPLDPSSSNSPLPSNRNINQKKRMLFSEELPPIIGSPEFCAALKKAEGERSREPKANTIKESSVISPVKPAEEDVSSISSGRSAPPQDPIVVKNPMGTASGGGLRAALMDEIVERGIRAEKQKGQENSITNTLPPKDTPPKRILFTEEIEQRPQMQIHTQPDRPRSSAQILTEEASTLSTQDISTKEIVQQQPPKNPKNFTILRPKSIEQQEIPNKIMAKTRIEKRVKKSLFSSSSSEEEEEKRPIKLPHVHVETRKTDEQTIVKSVVVVEKPTKRKDQSPGPIKITSTEEVVTEQSTEKEVQEVPERSGEEEEMSKPVFKPFDTSFSDRLTAIIQHGPQDRTLTRRPLSTHSIPSSGEDETCQQERPRSLRKTESAISSNEELGPATVKARIAQIGAQIPIGGRRGGEDINRRTMEEPRAGEEEQKAPLPAETIKTRAKGPTRRAPTQMGSKPPFPQIQGTADQQQKKQEEKEERPNFKKDTTQTAKQQSDMEQNTRTTTREKAGQGSLPVKSKVPPLVKQKTRSIFSSSSSDDEFGFRSKKATETSSSVAGIKLPIGTIAKRDQKQQEKKTATTVEPPFDRKKTAAPAKTRKGLFDDSESDF